MKKGEINFTLETVIIILVILALIITLGYLIKTKLIEGVLKLL